VIRFTLFDPFPDLGGNASGHRHQARALSFGCALAGGSGDVYVTIRHLDTALEVNVRLEQAEDLAGAHAGAQAEPEYAGVLDSHLLNERTLANARRHECLDDLLFLFVSDDAVPVSIGFEHLARSLRRIPFSERFRRTKSARSSLLFAAIAPNGNILTVNKLSILVNFLFDTEFNVLYTPVVNKLTEIVRIMSNEKIQLYDPEPIAVAMAKQNLTATEAAKKANLTEVTFRKIRNGQNVTLRNLRNAAQSLGLNAKVTFEDEAA
jgi:DNA-binding Xre family transcriptional regulator